MMLTASFDFLLDSRSSRRQWVFPLFYRSYSPEYTTFASPLAIYHHNKMSGGSALFMHLLFDYFDPTRGERYQGILPIFFRRMWSKESEELLVLPIYYRRHLKDEFTNTTHDTNAVFPFYIGTTQVEADGSLTYARHILFFPLFHRHYSSAANAVSYDILWPLLHYSRDPTIFSLRALPLLWLYENVAAHGKQLTRARVLLPLIYSLELATKHRVTAFFPFWLKVEGPNFGMF